MRTDEPLPLMTPQEVADLLRISLRTVYKKKHLLGPVYPAGLEVLRFRREVVYAAMEAQQPLEVRIRTSGEEIWQSGLPHQSRGSGGYGETSRRDKKMVFELAKKHRLLRGSD